MIILERQPSVTEKSEGEVPLAPDAREASVRRMAQRREVSRADVGQFPAFDVAPHLFDRIQLRRVPGQAFNRQPGALAVHVGLHGVALVGTQPVPEEQHAAAPNVALELPQDTDQRHRGAASTVRWRSRAAAAPGAGPSPRGPAGAGRVAASGPAGPPLSIPAGPRGATGDTTDARSADSLPAPA